MDDDDLEKVPKQRLSEVLEKLRVANARVGELEREVRTQTERANKAEETGRSASQLADRVAELESDLKAERAARSEDSAITRAGFTDPELVRFEYGRVSRDLGEDAPPLSEWLEGVKGDTAKAPPALRAALEAAGGTADQGDGDGDGETMRKGTTGRGGDAEDGQGSGGTSRGRNARLKEINAKHRVGSAEWAEEAAGVLGDEHPAVKRARAG